VSAADELIVVADDPKYDPDRLREVVGCRVETADLSTPAAVDETMAAFDDIVGADKLACVHLNDSKHDCGTNKDEHAHIGEGKIGEAGMEAVVNHELVRDVPLVLETPTEDGKSFAWNIERVKELRA